jgi:hypothetical protein
MHTFSDVLVHSGLEMLLVLESSCLQDSSTPSLPGFHMRLAGIDVRG